MYKVTVRGPDGSETHYPLGADQGLIIGRDESADIVLPSKRVSRRHARLYTSGTQLHIEDLESQNGIFVGGARISGTAEFRAGPPIEIGEFSIRVKREDPLAAENTYSGVLQGYGPWEGKTLELPKTKAIVGRDSTADLVIDSPSVSRKHAEIRFAGPQGYYVQDLGSANGTFLNGARLPPNVERPFRPNDRLNFGDTGWLATPQGNAVSKEVAQTRRRSFAWFVVGAMFFALVVMLAIFLVPEGPATTPKNTPDVPTVASIDRCQQDISDQNWPEAQKSCRIAYEEEPFVERRTYLRQAIREVGFKNIFDDCNRKATIGADREAIECFFAIESDSFYFPQARLQVHQLSQRLLKNDEAACRGAIRAKKPEKIIEACRNFLRYECHNGIDKDIQSQLTKAEATKKGSPAFECPAELTRWFKTGVTERYRREDYCEKNEETNICEGLLQYAQKKVGDAQKTVLKAPPKMKERSSRLREDMLHVSGRYGEGMSLAQGGRWALADDVFREVIESESRFMKRGAESDYIKDIRAKMGDHYQTAGDESMSGNHYDDAFKAYMAGLPYRPTLTDRLQALERVADQMLAEKPSCDRLPTIQAFTRPDSQEYREAAKRIQENCK